MAVFDKEPFIETFEDKVKTADHLGGKVNELIVKFSIVLLEMSSHYFETILLKQLDLI